MADTKKIIAATVATGLAVAAAKRLKESTEDGALKAGADGRASRSNAGNGAAKTQPSAGSADPVVYHVTPSGDGWSVRVESAERATSLHPTKRKALSAARDLVRRMAPSRLVIHRSDGTIQGQHSYGIES